MEIYNHLKAILDKVYVGIQYRISDEDPTMLRYTLATGNSALMPEGSLADKPDESHRHYVLWDVIGQDWIAIPFEKIKNYKYENFHLFPGKEQEDILSFDDFELDLYNSTFKKKIDDTLTQFDKLINDVDVQLTDDEKLRYRDLFFRPDLSGEQLALLAVFDANHLEDLQNIDIDAVKSVWMSLIRRYRDRALTFLDVEQEEEDDQDTLDEIEAVKQLLRDIPQDNALDDFETFDDITSFWPILLLPAPDFVSSLQQTVKSNK